MEEAFSNEINEHLLEGEKVLWNAKPNSKVPFLAAFVGICHTVFFLFVDIIILLTGFDLFKKNGSIPGNYFIILIFFLLVLVIPIYAMVIEKNNLEKHYICYNR